MAQTQNAVAQSNFQVQVSVDGTTWTDISGNATAISTSGGEQQIGSQNTADGDAAIVTPSQKYAPIDFQISIVYTKTTGEAFDIVMGQWESDNKSIYVRYAPEGGIGTVGGNDLFTLSDANDAAFAAPIVSILPPNLDASSGNPAIAQFTVRAPKATRSLTVDDTP